MSFCGGVAEHIELNFLKLCMMQLFLAIQSWEGDGKTLMPSADRCCVQDHLTNLITTFKSMQTTGLCTSTATHLFFPRNTQFCSKYYNIKNLVTRTFGGALFTTEKYNRKLPNSPITGLNESWEGESSLNLLNWTRLLFLCKTWWLRPWPCRWACAYKGTQYSSSRLLRCEFSESVGFASKVVYGSCMR